MKIKMLTSIASKEFSYGYNEEVDVKDKTAKRWIKAGIAEEVKDNESKASNTTSKRTSKSKRSKNSSKN